MAGAPSQLDLFDPKPELQKWHGKPLPSSIDQRFELAFIKPTATIMASRGSSNRTANAAWRFPIICRTQLRAPIHLPGALAYSVGL